MVHIIPLGGQAYGCDIIVGPVDHLLIFWRLLSGDKTFIQGGVAAFAEADVSGSAGLLVDRSSMLAGPGYVGASRRALDLVESSEGPG
ncbi:hypothetical protein DSUL_50212 [Desulfovibrionales bacterium]